MLIFSLLLPLLPLWWCLSSKFFPHSFAINWNWCDMDWIGMRLRQFFSAAVLAFFTYSSSDFTNNRKKISLEKVFFSNEKMRGKYHYENIILGFACKEILIILFFSEVCRNNLTCQLIKCLEIIWKFNEFFKV